MKKITKGFSLIELLVVIGIVAVLAALATFNFNTARVRARDAQRKSDLRTLRDAIELYKTDHNYNLPVYVAGESYPTADKFSTLINTLETGSFLKGTVSDPKESMKSESWQEYTYVLTGADTYKLEACLENKADEDAGVDCMGTLGKLYTLEM